MDHQTLAAHEAVDLHEIVNFKTLFKDLVYGTLINIWKGRGVVF